MDPAAQVEAFAKNLPNKMLARREIKKLPELLAPGETIIRMAQGRYEGKQGLVVATDSRVMFVESGMMRQRLEDFPYERISTIQSQTGMAFGKLVIHASGNKAVIDQIAPKALSDTLASDVRERLGEKPAATAAADGPAERLRKLAELRDAGVISEDEFAVKKAKLLDEI